MQNFSRQVEQQIKLMKYNIEPWQTESLPRLKSGQKPRILMSIMRSVNLLVALAIITSSTQAQSQPILRERADTSPDPGISLNKFSSNPLQDSQSIFGSFNVATVVARREAEPHPYDARGILALNKEALGSGIDGQKSAAAADFAALVQSKKTNWLTSRQAGEIDGLVLITRQGRKGDAASLLFNGEKVKDTGTDTGGMTGLEGEMRWVTQTGTPVLGMHLTMGILEGAGSSTGNTGNGFVAEASKGKPFAAFAADGLATGSGAFPAWQYLLWGSATRNASDVYATIDSTGNQFLKGDLRLNGSVIAAHTSTPHSSTAPCTVGQSAWDANYEYRCVALNTWKRSALNSW